MYPRYYGPGVGIGLFGGLLMLIFWVAVVALVVSLVRRAGVQGHWHSHLDHHLDQRDHHEDPLDIAKVRYARGEITKAELDQIKKDLA